MKEVAQEAILEALPEEVRIDKVETETAEKPKKTKPVRKARTKGVS